MQRWLKAPLLNCCDIQLQILATSTEQSNGSTASTVRTLTIKQLTGTQVATPATVSPYVTSTQTSATSSTQISVSGVTTVQPSSTVGLIVNPTTQWEQEEYAEQQKALALTTDWLLQLELNAQQNWSQFIGGL